MFATGGALRRLVARRRGDDGGSANGEAPLSEVAGQGGPGEEALDVGASIADLDESVGDPGFGIDAVEPAGCDPGAGIGTGFDGVPGACEEGVSQGEPGGSLIVLDGVGVQVEAAFREEAAEAGPCVVLEAVGDGGGFGGGFAEAEAVCGTVQEVAQVFAGGLQHALPDAEALVGRLAEDAVLDAEQVREAKQRGVAKTGFGQLVAFSPPVDVTELQGDRTAGSGGIGEHVVCGVSVDLRRRKRTRR